LFHLGTSGNRSFLPGSLHAASKLKQLSGACLDLDYLSLCSGEKRKKKHAESREARGKTEEGIEKQWLEATANGEQRSSLLFALSLRSLVSHLAFETR
jgi:hypothetical protein